MKSSKNATVKRAKPLLGTFVVVSVKAIEEKRAQEAVAAAFTIVEKVQGLMSSHDPGSEISRLSRQASGLPLTVHPWTHEVLHLSRSISLASGGFFDVTVGGKLEAMGFLPPSNPLARSWSGANYADIELLPDFRVLLRRPCRIDLGGIAKGYAVDKAVEAAFQVPGVRDVVINAGGDLRVKAASPQALWLRDPFHPGSFWPAGYLMGGALASSGGTEAVRNSNQGLRTPLLCPGQGRFPKFVPGITVLAPSCAIADALTKVVLFAPAKMTQKVLKSFQAEAWVAVDGNGFKEFSLRPDLSIPHRLRRWTA